VRRSPAVRLVTLVLAMFVSLSAPAQALAHGWTHAHLAHDHEAEAAHDAHDAVVADEHHADAASAELEPASHGHEHGHATISVAPGVRDVGRFLAPAVLAQAARIEPVTAIVEVRSAALPEHALLARPAPDDGPPPTLRAPPAC
jgi:hypothetical protein